MTDTPVIRWPLPTVEDGAGFACPTCGAAEGILAALDAEDSSADPTYLECPAGHLWAEQRFPRFIGASILRRILAADPNALGHLGQQVTAATAAQPSVKGSARWEGPLRVDGVPLLCPECGATHGLVLTYDSDDSSRDPAPMSCPAGHEWLEPRMPRWMAPDIARAALALGRDERN
ncbi:hypothetical protein [Streptomyces sp. NPDC006784]|uniref:hypothetical protein n=1 Tax=Streptomyces sp. NPDC006784 TaxID=3364764 RepID=UPI0036B37C3B